MAKSFLEQNKEIVFIALVIAVLVIATNDDINLENLFSGIGRQPSNITYVPPEKDSCTDYDISSEIRKAADSVSPGIIDMFRNNCTSIGGIWIEDSSELSCYWDPLVDTVDCNRPVLLGLEWFCENQLEADWTCDNSKAYVGCSCEQALPPDWNLEAPEPEPEQEPAYTCGWTGDTCSGTCPPTHPNCDSLDWASGDVACGCIDIAGNVHESWKPGGQYYNPHEEGVGVPEYRIFATNLQWTGPLGRLAGADVKCQVWADFGGLGGTWRAILSDSTTNAIDRVPDGRYIRIDNIVIADSKADLFDGTLHNPININENGEVVSGKVWTGTSSDGNRLGLDCNDWGFVDSSGFYGDVSKTGAGWLQQGVQTCENVARIYCVET